MAPQRGDATMPRGEIIGEWREYPDGSRVFFLHRPPGEIMEEPTLVYLTLPTSDDPILNIQINDRFLRLRVNRDQLFGLNADIADALIRGRQRRLPNGQLDLALPTEH
jgi:hypothetical protein